MCATRQAPQAKIHALGEYFHGAHHRFKLCVQLCRAEDAGAGLDERPGPGRGRQVIVMTHDRRFSESVEAQFAAVPPSFIQYNIQVSGDPQP